MLESYAAKDRKAHRIWVAVPRLNAFLKRGEDCGVRQGFRSTARTDSDGPVAGCPPDRFANRCEGRPEIERLDADGSEVRLQSLESPEPRGSERVPTRDDDQAIVRHEPQRREDVTFIESHRRNQRPIRHKVTRRAAPSRGLASQSSVARRSGPRGARWPPFPRALGGGGSLWPCGRRAPAPTPSP